MFTLSNYSFIEELQTGARTRTCRYIRLQDNKNVILKFPRSEHPLNREIASLEHEYYLLKQLEQPGIIHAYELISPELTPILVLEDINGLSLAAFLAGHPLNLEMFFQIALQLVDILNTLHQHHIIHKDIKPTNIIIDPNTLKIKVIDLSISTQLEEEIQEGMNPDLLEGTLAYMSPEQTGRMNRPIDYRTDFYSLGVTFFEMLTGELPFRTKDPLELVYFHIAKMPPRVTEINSDIPEMLSAIVAKLMAKMPEERYVHARSLKADLEKCAEQWRAKKTIEPFELGQHDIQDHLQLSHKLYGREDQIETLLEVFEHVSHGKSQLMLIAGSAGVGKTSLINEVHKPITKNKGYFVAGKYNQLQRSIPYSALVVAFKSLVLQALAEPEIKLNQLKQNILAAVEKNGQVIIDIIPEVELIIGPQPSVPSLNPMEGQNRFNFVFQRFVAAFAQEEHPLVVFLDDLQWADIASLKLLDNLLTDPSTRYLLLIGAYRDNEVTANHPLLASLQKLQDAEVPIQSLNLQPLQQVDIEHLLEDVFSRQDSEVTALAKLLLSKTNGNPFFINEFLKMLYLERVIKFSHEQGQWLWNITEIEQQKVTDNVVDLLVTKIQRLSTSSQQLLKLAACIGYTFELQTLALTSEQPLAQVAAELGEIQRSNLTIPLGDAYKITALLEGEPAQSKILVEEKLLFRFAHDRIQQAAYSLIPDDERQQMHLKIGRLLLKNHPLHEQDEQLFNQLDHFNQGLSLLTSPSEKQEIARYNLWGSKKAKASGAYQAASDYLKAGISLLASDAWEKDYALSYSLHQEQMECFYLLWQFPEADSYFKHLMLKAKSNLEKAETSLIKIRAYNTAAKYDDSLATARQALRLFNFKLPKRVSQFGVLSKVALIHYHIGFRTITELDTDLVRLTDQNLIVVRKLLDSSIVACFFADLNLYAYVVCTIVNLSIVAGYTEESSTAFLVYGVLLIAALNKIPLAAKFVTLAKKMENKAYSEEVSTRNHFFDAFFIKHWYEHAGANLDYLRESYQRCLAIGNLEYAENSMTIDFTLYYISTPLPEITQKFSDDLAFLKRVGNKSWYNHLQLQQFINLSLQGEDIPSQEFDALWEKIKQDYSLSFQTGSHIEYCEYLYLIGDYPAAFEHAQLFFDNRKRVAGYIGSVFGALFYGLLLAKCYAHASRKQKFIYWQRLLTIQKQLKYWTKYCPSNFRFMYLVISAEIGRISGDKVEKVARLYDEAILEAQINGYVNYLGVISECAAQFGLDLHRVLWAKPYIQQAYFAYQRWGATYKCQMLAKQYPEWISEMAGETIGDITHSSGTVTSQSLDFGSIMKSSQAIASEIHLDKLLQKLLQIVIENAGAQRGALLFEQQKQLLVVAEGDNEQHFVINQLGIPLEKHTNLPKSILVYVQRIKEKLILNDAREIEKFQNDIYIQTTKPKSLLCMPILLHGIPTGYMYLENRLTPYAFTPERLKVLELLAGNSAVALENAKLYMATGRFVPHEFLQQINRKNIVEVQLGDQIQQEMTILFCDIRDFTALSENITPAEVFKLINKFFGYLEPVIKKHKGFVDKYIGDAIMALFERPADAVKAGLEMIKELTNFNKEREQNHEAPIRVGIGINTGELMLGIIGDPKRIEGTVIGDAVNIASRIEGLTRQFEGNLLISDATKVKLRPGAFELTAVGSVLVKGKAKPLTIWSVQS